MTKRNLEIQCFAGALVAWCSAFACSEGVNDDGKERTADPAPVAPVALVITTDRQTGAFSTVAAAKRAVTPNLQVIHSDSICRFDPITDTPFIVSRLGADSVTALDPGDGWSASVQYSVGAGTNAQDIAVVSEERAYIPRFDDPELLVVHPTRGDELQRIDLSAYADEDGNPEAALAYPLDGEVYVVLQRIDETWTPTDYSSVVVIDGEDGELIDEVRLTAKNPVGKLRYSEAVRGLVLIEAGSFGTHDGGIEYLRDDTLELSGLVITEEALGGDVVDAVIVSETKGYAIIGVYKGESASSRLVSFDPSSGEKRKELIASEDWDLGYLELTPDGAELWVSDRALGAPGIRIFDVADDSELTPSPIDVGLPPSMVCFVQ